jgi:beta-aspartyl-dipeptidase (metallo-type)
MFVIVQNGEVYTPEPAAKVSVLIAGDKIARLGSMNGAAIEGLGLGLETLDASDAFVFPGLIDPHEHLIGGSGESGFATLTPEIQLQELVRGGITTVVGCLGVDTTTRTMPALLAKAKGLTAEGVSAYVYTGGYNVPPMTLTGSVRSDMLLVQEVIGAGETAIADLRSTQPHVGEIARLVADAYVGGILSGKAGVTHFHVGPRQRRLAVIRELLDSYDVQPDSIYLTHVERSPELMDEAVALAQRGVMVDIDTFDEDLPHWLAYFTKAGGDLSKLTVSSDAAINSPETLATQIFQFMSKNVASVEQCLRLVTANTARVLKLDHKGALSVGSDADLIVVERSNWRLRHVVARGKVMMRDGRVVVEESSMAQSNRRFELHGKNHG